MNKYQVDVSVSNLEQLKSLSTHLTKECEQAMEKVDEINKLQLEIEV